jgi:hypothetical protein
MLLPPSSIPDLIVNAAFKRGLLVVGAWPDDAVPVSDILIAESSAARSCIPKVSAFAAEFFVFETGLQ